MLVGALALALLLAVGLVIGLIRSRRQVPSADIRHWICSREGLVRFGPEAVVMHAWNSLQRVERREGGVAVQLHTHATPDFFAMQAHATMGAYLQELEQSSEDGTVLWVPDSMMAGLQAEQFVETLEHAIHKPESRRELPTFYQPDGPPEAVLSGVD